MPTTQNAAKLQALKARSTELHLAEFWSEVRTGRLGEPQPSCSPFVWHFDEVAPQLWEAAELVPVEEAERRAVVFKNPALGGRIATTPTMYAAYSLYNPGEHAPVHRHTVNAGRIGLAGTGGYTTVDGVKCMIGRGDLVLTPSWSWHDHGNDGSEPNIWFDILDQPLSVMLGSRFFDFDYEGPSGAGSNTRIQAPKLTVSSRHNPYAVGGVFSTGPAAAQLPRNHTIFYEFARIREALEIGRAGGTDPHDAVSVRLRNEHSGGPALGTIDISVALLPGGFGTQPVRQSCSTIFLVIEGSGHTVVGDERIDWGVNDVFVVPNWSWFRHVNAADSRDAVLYVMTDEPLMRKVEGWRRQGRQPDGRPVMLG